MKRIRLSTAGLLLLLASCANAVNTVERDNPRAVTDDVLFAKVVFSGELDRQLGVENVVEAQREELLLIQTTLRNLGRSEFQYIYMYEWFDDQGLQVSTPTSTWVPRVIQGGEQHSLVGVAPSPRVVDFRLKLQESD